MTRPAKPKKKPSGPSGKHLHAGVLVRAPDAEREAWDRAAKSQSMTRVEWIRAILNDAAEFVFARQAAKKKDRAKNG